MNFIEATDPRFVGLSEAVVTSLDERRSVSRFDGLLVNRTQISAITETDHGSERIAAALASGSGGGFDPRAEGTAHPAPGSTDAHRSRRATPSEGAS
jgi:hypothetical protein